ncbi:MAG: hypothetical protein ACYC5N_08975, partial [Endomicrobiales bacterium]
GETKGRKFVVTAAVEGETLRDLIEKRRREPETFPANRPFSFDFHEVLSLLERLVLSGILVKNFNPDNIVLGHRPYAKLDRAYIIDASGVERQKPSLELIQAYQAQLRDWSAAGPARLMLSDYLDTLLRSPEWKAAMGGRQSRRPGAIFFGSFEQGPVEQPVTLRERLHNLRHALGEPFTAAPLWETIAFPLLGLVALPSLLVAAGFAPLLALGAGALYVTAGFALAHPASPLNRGRDLLARSALSFLLSAPFLAPAAVAAFSGTSLASLASAAPFAAAAYLAVAAAGVAVAHSRYNRAVLSGRAPSWLRGLVLSVFGQDESAGGRKMVYVGKTNDSYNYPIYLMPDGRRVIRKYALSMSNIDFALNARLAYVTAQRLGFAGINQVELDFGEPGSVSSLEEFYGVSLDESTTLDRAAVSELLGELSWGDATAEVYPRLVRRLGPSFVEGDIYRMFSNFFGDSGAPNNIRISDETGELRWIDYNLTFFPQQTYDQRDARAYVQSHAPYFLAHGKPLVEAIARLDDEAIEANAEEVYGGETRERLVRKFVSENGLTETLALKKADTVLAEHRDIFVSEIKWRRGLFREILPDPARDNAAPAAKPVFGQAPANAAVFPAEKKLPAMNKVQGLALKAGLLGAAGMTAALTDASARLFGAGSEFPGLAGRTVYWLAGEDELPSTVAVVSDMRSAAGANGIVVSNMYTERGAPKGDDRIWLGRVLVPAGANDFEPVGVWAVVEGEQNFDRAGRMVAIRHPVVVTYFERHAKSRVRSQDLDRTGRLKVISLLDTNKVARRNLAGLYGRWNMATAGRDADRILSPAAIVSEDPHILDGIRGDDLIDLKGAAKGRKWEMIHATAVVGMRDVAGESAARALGIIAAAVRDREAQGFQKGYDLIVRLATGGQLLEAGDGEKLARLMKVMRGGSVRLDELPLTAARPDQEAQVRRMIEYLRESQLKVHFSLAAKPGQSLEELGAAASAWLGRRGGPAGFDGVELDLAGREGLQSGALAAWLNGIGREHPEALITVVLPRDRQGDREDIKKALNENVSVASEVTVDETRRGNPAEIAGEANECVKLRLKDFDGRLEEYVRAVNAGIVEVWLGDLAGLEPDEQQGRGKGILSLLDGMAEDTFAHNAGALAALLSSNPESVYRSTWKYEGEDVPDAQAADAIARLLAGYGLGGYAAGKRTHGELQAGVRAIGKRSGEFAAEARKLDVNGAVKKRLDVLAEKAETGGAAGTENLAAFLAGIGERALAKESREQAKKAGFLEAWQEKEFGRALLAGLIALNSRKTEGETAQEKMGYASLEFTFARADRGTMAERLKGLQPASGDIKELVRYLELVSAYYKKAGRAAGKPALIPGGMVQAVEQARRQGEDVYYGAAVALLRELGEKTSPAPAEQRVPALEEIRQKIDAAVDVTSLRLYVTALQESGLVAADYLLIANRAAVRAKELSKDSGPLALSEYLKMLDLLSDLKEVAGVRDDMKKILNSQGIYAMLGAA